MISVEMSAGLSITALYTLTSRRGPAPLSFVLDPSQGWMPSEEKSGIVVLQHSDEQHTKGQTTYKQGPLAKAEGYIIRNESNTCLYCFLEF